MPFVQNNVTVDTLLTIAEITINMIGNNNPLYVSEFEFSTVGTASHIRPKIRLYRGENISASILVSTVNVTTHDTYTFNLSPSQ